MIVDAITAESKATLNSTTYVRRGSNKIKLGAEIPRPIHKMDVIVQENVAFSLTPGHQKSPSNELFMNSNRTGVSHSKNHISGAEEDDLRNIQKIPRLVVDDFEDFQAELPETVETENEKEDDSTENTADDSNDVFEKEVFVRNSFSETAVCQWFTFILLLPIRPFLILHKQVLSSVSYYRVNRLEFLINFAVAIITSLLFAVYYEKSTFN